MDHGTNSLDIFMTSEKLGRQGGAFQKAIGKFTVSLKCFKTEELAFNFRLS